MKTTIGSTNAANSGFLYRTTQHHSALYSFDPDDFAEGNFVAKLEHQGSYPFFADKEAPREVILRPDLVIDLMKAIEKGFWGLIPEGN